MKKYLLLTVTLLFVLTIALTGCGSGSTANLDTDNDGIPDNGDGFPTDGTQFIALTNVPLTIPAESNFSTAVAVSNIDANDSILVIGTRNTALGGLQATKWSVDTITQASGPPQDLNPLTGEAFSAAYGINDAGTVVGESSKNAGIDFVAVLWEADSGTPTELTLLEPATWSAVYSLNNDGLLVGESEEVVVAGKADRAVIWTSSTAAPVVLTTPFTSISSSAYQISDNGNIIGEATDNAGFIHAMFWKVDAAGVQTGEIDLPVPAGSINTIALDVNDTGVVTGEFEDAAGLIHAISWVVDTTDMTALAPTNLETLTVESSAAALNGTDIFRAVGWVNDGTMTFAVIYDSRLTGEVFCQMVLDPTVLFSQAYDINADDVVVGMMQTATGDSAFVAVP